MQWEEAVLGSYSWVWGSCFRCADERILTAFVDELPTPTGELHVLRACRRCILLIEQERAREAERRTRRQCGVCALEEEEPL